MASARSVSLLADTIRAFRAIPHVPTGVLRAFAGDCCIPSVSSCCGTVLHVLTVCCRTNPNSPCQEPTEPVVPDAAARVPPAASHPALPALSPSPPGAGDACVASDFVACCCCFATPHPAFLASGSPSPTLPAADVRPPPAEEDKHQDCGAWAKAGECKNNPGFMKSECAASCSGSNERDTWHNASECLAWAGSGECESNAAFMDVNCALSCGRIVRSREEYKARCKRPEGMKPVRTPSRRRPFSCGVSGL